MSAVVLTRGPINCKVSAHGMARNAAVTSRSPPERLLRGVCVGARALRGKNVRAPRPQGLEEHEDCGCEVCNRKNE
jgi:hypothetical protein